MIPRVQIEEELFTTAAAVRIDGQKTSSLSPLAACAGGRFLEYAAHLPHWLEQECNGAYTVTFCGGALEESILRMLFGRETACKGFSAAPGPKEMIRFEERLQAAQHLGGAFDAPKPLGVCCLSKGTLAQSILTQMAASRWKKEACGWRLYPACGDWSPCISSKTDNAARVFVENAAERGLHQLENVNTGMTIVKSGDVLYSVDPAAGNVPHCTGLLQIGGAAVPLFAGRAENFPAFAALWAERFVIRPALARLQAALAGQPLHPRQFDAFEEKAMRSILTSPLPVAAVAFPDEMELGTVHSADRLRRYPARFQLELRTTPGGLLQAGGGAYHAAREGTVKVQLYTHGYASPEVLLAEKSVRIRKVNRVQTISLTLPQQDIVPRQEFRVDAHWMPQNAENLQQAAWSVEPAGLAVPLGGGRFRACQAGRGIVRLTIGQVKAEIPFAVRAVPAAIRLPQEVTLKMGQEVPVPFTLAPAGAAAQVQGRTMDPDVARYDEARGVIVPCREGSTTLELYVPTPVGTACVSRCAVVIGPEHDIINPDWPNAIMALTGALGLLTFSTVVSLLLAGVCMGCGLYQLSQALEARRAGAGWKQTLLSAAAGTAGGLFLLLVQLL